MVLDGCPMFASAYMGRKRIFSNAFTLSTTIFDLDHSLFPRRRALEGLRLVFFGPCTLGRTWSTRPGTEGFVLYANRSAADERDVLQLPHP